MFFIIIAIIFSGYSGIFKSRTSVMDSLREIVFSNKNKAQNIKQLSTYFNSTSISTINNYLLKICEDGVRMYDKNGIEVLSVVVRMKNPTIKTKDNFAIIADLEGTEALLIENKNVLWKKNFDKKIVNIDLNNKGDVSIIYKLSDGSLSAFVYNKEFRNIFSLNEINRLIINAKMSDFSDLSVLNLLIYLE